MMKFGKFELIGSIPEMKLERMPRQRCGQNLIVISFLEKYFSTVDRLWLTDRNIIRKINPTTHPPTHPSTHPPTDAYIHNANIPLACYNPILEDSIVIVIISIIPKLRYLFF